MSRMSFALDFIDRTDASLFVAAAIAFSPIDTIDVNPSMTSTRYDWESDIRMTPGMTESGFRVGGGVAFFFAFFFAFAIFIKLLYLI